MFLYKPFWRSICVAQYFNYKHPDGTCFIHSISLKNLNIIAHPAVGNGRGEDIHEFVEKLVLIPENTKLCYRITEGTARSIMTVKEFQELGEGYIKRNKDPTKRRWVEKFPPNFMEKDEMVLRIRNLFDTYFNQRCLDNEETSFSCVLTATSMAQHISNLIDSHSLASLAKSRQSIFYPRKDSKTILILDSIASTILILGMVRDIEDLELATRNCNNELKAFIRMHLDFLQSNTVLVVGTIVIPNLGRNEISKEITMCDDCLPLYLTRDELEDFEIFSSWYKNLSDSFLKDRFKRLSSTQAAHLLEQDKNELQLYKIMVNIAGNIMAVLALTNTHLPVLTDSIHDQITTVVLNKEQLDIIHSDEKKKIIIGPFGSGKTLVAKEIVKRLMTTPTTRAAVVFYLCCDPFSLLEVEMNQYAETLRKDYAVKSSHSVKIKVQNIQEIAALSSSPVTDLPRILEYLCNTVQSNVSMVHFILDEICGESITEIIAWKLRVLFSQHYLLKMSEVAFFIRSLQKCREFKSKNSSPQLYSGNRFGETNMHIIYLKKIMRVTSAINKVLESAQDEIVNTSSVYNHMPATKFSNLPKRSNSQELKKEIIREKVVTDEDESIMETLPHHPISTNVISKTEGTFQDDFDKLTLLVTKRYGDVEHVEDVDQTVTHLKYLKGTMGHCIEGFKPMLLFLPKVIQLYSEPFGKFLSIVISKLLLRKQLTSCAFICTNIQECQLVAYALTVKAISHIIFTPELDERYPTTIEKERIIKSIKEKKAVLVTDNRGFRGCEIQCLLSFIDPKNYFTRHELGEIIARATVSVTLLVLPINEEKEQGTSNDVICTWMKDDLLDVLHVQDPNWNIDESIESSNVIQITSEELCNCKDISFTQFVQQTHVFPVDTAKCLQSIDMFQQSALRQDVEVFQSVFETHLKGKKWSLQDLISIINDNDKSAKELELILRLRPFYADYRDNQNNTLLHIAAELNAHKSLAVLLKCIEPTVRNKKRSTPLHVAASSNSVECLRLLVNVDSSMMMSRDVEENTPLHCAAFEGNIDVFKYALDLHNMNDLLLLKNKFGKTPVESTLEDSIRELLREKNYGNKCMKFLYLA